MWPWNYTVPASHVATVDAPTNAATVTFLNEHLPLLPLPMRERELPYADQLTGGMFHKHVLAYASDRQWGVVRRLIAQKGKLVVAVLGVSATAGGGAGDDWDLLEHVNKSGATKVSRDKSWTRRLADNLAEGLTMPVHVSTWYKNAVHAEYFAHCIESFLPHGDSPHVVLLEFAPNLWQGDPGKVVRAVQRAAPKAVVAFAVWPSQSQYRSASRNVDLLAINASAAQLEADVVSFCQCRLA